MRRASVLLVLGAAVAACGPTGPPDVRFVRVEGPDGFRFRHELPGGRLDSLPKAAMGGFAVVDVDQDGRLDLYFVNGGWHESYANAGRPSRPAPNRLLRNLGGMRFEDVTEGSGADDTGFGMGVCVGDFDNDGAPDLFVSNYGGSALLRNRGDGSFEDVTERAGISAGFHAGATFLDYDRDGLLDLFVGQYVDPARPVTGMRMGGHGGGADPLSLDVPPPAAYQPLPAFLYRNRGDGTFVDVTQAAGVGRPGKAMAVLATDVDDDGWIDVLVANDAEANFVWRNRGDGSFEDVAPIMGMAYGPSGNARGSMGVSAADMDGDGRLDYLVPDTVGGCVFVAREHAFVDRARDWGFPSFVEPMTGWADVPIDVENDGLVDVFKTHGELRTLRPQLSLLLQAREVGRFERAPGGPEEIRACARGGIAADLDDDGRVDLVTLVLEGKAVIAANRTENAREWIALRLVGTDSNAMALGAKVTARAGERPLVAEVSGATGYMSGVEPRLHFGLGDASAITDVVVRWPNGRTQEFGTLPAGQLHVLRER